MALSWFSMGLLRYFTQVLAGADPILFIEMEISTSLSSAHSRLLKTIPAASLFLHCSCLSSAVYIMTTLCMERAPEMRYMLLGHWIGSNRRR